MSEWLAVEPLTDDAENAAWWAPPELKVGDRVRLAGNGECPMHSPVGEAITGELGTVVEVDREEEHGHGYKVRIDRPQLLPATWMAEYGPWCAAGELEPL